MSDRCLYERECLGGVVLVKEVRRGVTMKGCIVYVREFMSVLVSTLDRLFNLERVLCLFLLRKSVCEWSVSEWVCL